MISEPFSQCVSHKVGHSASRFTNYFVNQMESQLVGRSMFTEAKSHPKIVQLKPLNVTFEPMVHLYRWIFPATRTSKYDVCNLHFPNLKVDELFFLTKSRTNDMMITVRVAAEIMMTGRSQFFVPPADLNKKVWNSWFSVEGFKMWLENTEKH